MKATHFLENTAHFFGVKALIEAKILLILF